MANKYQYKITPAANSDLDNILAYIANELHAPDSAIALLDNIVHHIEAACDFPESHPLINDPLLAMRGYRKIVINKYLAIYLIAEQEQTRYVARIVYSGQDYLKER